MSTWAPGVVVAVVSLTAGCASGHRARLSAPEKLTFIDCLQEVQARVCPSSHDCEAQARARFARAPREARASWLVAHGCPRSKILARAQLLARWEAEGKQPVRGSTKRRWALQRWLSDMGCVLTAPFCMAIRQAKSRANSTSAPRRASSGAH